MSSTGFGPEYQDFGRELGVNAPLRIFVSSDGPKTCNKEVADQSAGTALALALVHHRNQ